MSPWWLMIPILSALIGWLTIQLAARLFFSWILPKRRHQWTATIARQISQELFGSGLLEQKVASPESFQKIMPQVEVHVDNFLRQGLPKAFPVISTFIGERTIGQLKEIFLKELETIFPAVMKSYVGNLQQDLDLEQAIIDKVGSFTSESIQIAAYQAIGSDLNKAAALAAGLGLIIGLAQLGIVMATVTY